MQASAKELSESPTEFKNMSLRALRLAQRTCVSPSLRSELQRCIDLKSHMQSCSITISHINAILDDVPEIYMQSGVEGLGSEGAITTSTTIENMVDVVGSDPVATTEYVDNWINVGQDDLLSIKDFFC